MQDQGLNQGAVCEATLVSWPDHYCQTSADGKKKTTKNLLIAEPICPYSHFSHIAHIANPNPPENAGPGSQSGSGM